MKYRSLGNLSAPRPGLDLKGSQYHADHCQTLKIGCEDHWIHRQPQMEVGMVRLFSNV